MYRTKEELVAEVDRLVKETEILFPGAPLHLTIAARMIARIDFYEEKILQISYRNNVIQGGMAIILVLLLVGMVFK